MHSFKNFENKLHDELKKHMEEYMKSPSMSKAKDIEVLFDIMDDCCDYIAQKEGMQVSVTPANSTSNIVR